MSKYSWLLNISDLGLIKMFNSPWAPSRLTAALGDCMLQHVFMIYVAKKRGIKLHE